MWKKRHVLINDDLFCSETLTPELAWFMGLFAADGCISRPDKYGKSNISISQSGPSGAKLIKFVQKILGHTGKVHRVQTSGKDAYSIYFRSEPFVIWAAKHGILPGKTKNLQLSSTLPDRYFPHFLRGYIDGDGCLGIYPTGTTDVFLVSVAGLSEVLDAIHKRSGVFARKYQLTTSDPPLWELRWYGERGIQVAEFLYDTGLRIPGYKEAIYRKFLKENFTRYMKYSPKKEKVLQLLDEGCYSAVEISMKVEIPFQTVYKWRKKWRPHVIFRAGKMLTN